MVLSGYTELQSIIDAVNEGAIYRFLTKPWDDERLRSHVAEAFRQKGMVDENRRLAAQVESVNADLAKANARLAHLLNQQREHAELLAANADSVRALLDDLPAAVVGVDPDGVVVFVNRSADELLPHAAELLGRHADEVLPARVLGDDQASAPGGDIVEYAGRRYRLMTRALHGGAEARGRLLLLLLLPSDQTEGVPT
jgi:PAS domain-containing protein